jgi:hypothetical protein
MRTVLCLAVAAAIALLAPTGVARADELSRLYALILKDPGNVELNLRYARLAEEQGDLRKALSAYERVMANTPANYEAQEGFRRIVRKLAPEGTRVTVELGGGWESNPARVARNAESDWLGLARVDLRDERRFGETTWRTNANAFGDFYAKQGDTVNYAAGGGYTGPIIDIGQFSLHVAAGGGAALYGDHFLHREATAVFTLESAFWNGIQTGRVRVGFREYGEFFGGSDGVYVDATERLAWVGVLARNDIFIAAPWYRWSDIQGTPLNLPLEETQPGRYWEAGLRAEYFRPLTNWLVLGGSLAAGYRNFKDVTFLKDNTPVLRHDRFYIAGAAAIFPKLLFDTADLRIDYRYEDNRSNVPFDTYTNHQVTTTAIYRF